MTAPYQKPLFVVSIPATNRAGICGPISQIPPQGARSALPAEPRRNFFATRLELPGYARRDSAEAFEGLHRLTALHARNVAHGGRQCPGKILRETSFGGAR